MEGTPPRGTFTRKRGDRQHILHHQAELERTIKFGVELKEGRFCEFWFMVPVPPAQSLEEHKDDMQAHFQEKVRDLFPTWTVPILGSTSQDYRVIAKAINDTVEIWYTPGEWFRDNALPVASHAVPKAWVTFQGREIFIAPYWIRILELDMRRVSSVDL
jgi:hypothetical protein